MLDVIGKVVGAFLDKNTADKNRDAQQQMAANNIAMQREFAQNGIQWRVADAQAAGIHPLAALGSQLTSFSPVTLGAGSDSNYKDALGGMGQDITRAINATRSQTQRDQAFTETTRSLELAGKNLDNELKATTLASAVQRLKQNSNPPLPTDTVPESKKFEDRPRLMMGGTPIVTDPLTSNTEDAEKRYGDDGPASWMWGLATGWNDYKATSGGGASQGLGHYVRKTYDWANRALRKGAHPQAYW